MKEGKLSIVCGAPNLEAGQLVPVALVGANLPGDLVIEETEIRGEKSFGMICAEDELGLGEGHEGIMVLDSKAKVGQKLSEYLGLSDVVLEVDNKSLSNRGDLLNHYGIARELGVIFDLPIKDFKELISEKIKFPEPESEGLKAVEVKVENEKACPRYLAVRVSNIEVKESPAWLRDRLIAVNQRPINNIVDLTNYVLLEVGQPMHAFSADRVEKIVVRQARQGERMKTLDEKERILLEEDLVISDGDQVLALAGIMGALNSGIESDTKEIILESANFQASGVRKTSQRLGLRSESSTRFEKSLDPLLAEQGMMRFLSLLLKVCPQAKISSPLVDIGQVSEVEDLEIPLELDWLNTKIGQEIPRESVINILSKLGFKVTETAEANLLTVKVPSWRAVKDVAIKEDLVEEVLRIYGYNNIKSQLPTETLSLPELNQERMLEREIKNILSLKHSLTETYNYSFVGESQLEKLEIDSVNHLRLANPSNEGQTLLRQSLVPNLLGAAKLNQARGENFGLFEIGRVFFNLPGFYPKDKQGSETIPHQEKRLGIVLSDSSQEQFAKLKSIIASLFKDLINRQLEVKFVETEEAPAWARPGAAVKIMVADKDIGIIAGLKSLVVEKNNFKKKLAVAELSLEEILKLSLTIPGDSFTEIPKYPALSRDLAFVLSRKISYNEIKEEIDQFSDLIKGVEVFDVYSGEGISAEEKGLAFRLTFQSADKTLTTEEVDELIKQLVAQLTDKFSLRWRE